MSWRRLSNGDDVKANDLQPLTLIPLICRTEGLPLPETEFKFHPSRKWRFDFCWPAPYWVALEVEGGLWKHGRHVRGTGYLKDMEKYNYAAILGWKVLRCTPQTAHEVRDLLVRALKESG